MASSSPSDISLLGKIADYTEVLVKDPGSTVFVPLADTYRQLGMLDEALEVAEQGAKALPRFAPGYMILGRLFLERKDVDRAIAALEKAYTLDSVSLPVIQGLAQALATKGSKARAREILEKGILHHPEDSDLRQMLGSMGPENGESAACVGNEEDPIATSTIAEIYLKQGLPKRALKVYRELLHADPQNEKWLEKVKELEASLGAGPVDTAAGLCVSPSAGVPPEVPVEDQEKYLVLLDRWLTAIRERKAHVR